MSGTKSRRKGHTFEREVIKKLKSIGFNDAHSARSGDRSMDEKGADILGCPPFWIQCKAWKSAPNLHKELKKMPDDIMLNVVMHKRPNQGTVVAMTLEDFIEILQMLKSEKII